jgi:hypothetical protein
MAVGYRCVQFKTARDDTSRAEIFYEYRKEQLAAYDNKPAQPTNDCDLGRVTEWTVFQVSDLAI